jgi:hypothetical protein
MGHISVIHRSPMGACRAFSATGGTDDARAAGHVLKTCHSIGHVWGLISPGLVSQ